MSSESTNSHAIVRSKNYDLIRKYYYDPSYGILSAAKFHQRLKSELGKNTPTLKEIDAFIKQQKVGQVFYRPVIKHKNQYPILAKFGPFSKLMIDLMDVSSEHPNDNRNDDGKATKFIFVCIDVYTRYVFAVPMPNKTGSEILKAFKSIMTSDIMKKYQPKHGYYIELISDNESGWSAPKNMESSEIKEFGDDEDDENSGGGKAFSKYCLNTKTHPLIKQTLVRDEYKRKSIVERFIRTLRWYMRKYMAAHNTNKYIDALSNIIDSYNNSIHSTLGTTPKLALENNSIYDNRILNKLVRLKKGDKLQPLKVGDKVRVLIKKKHYLDSKEHDVKQFVKEDQQFENQIRTIEETFANKPFYKVSGYETLFKRNELLYVPNESTVDEYVAPANNNDTAYDRRQQLRKDNTKKRRLNNEGANNANVLPTTTRPIRNKTDIFNYQHPGEAANVEKALRESLKASGFDEIVASLFK